MDTKVFYDSRYHYIIDNGHGRNTKGKRSKEWDNGKQLFEFKFNRLVASFLFTLLKESNIDFTELVPELEDVKLRRRTKRANKLSKNLGKPTIFISIHGNWYSDPDVKGVETFFYPGSEDGFHIGQIFQSNICQETGWRDRGVKPEKFYVLRKTKMPAILTENGFYSNFEQCMKMVEASWQKRIAYAHYRAIKDIEENGVK